MPSDKKDDVAREIHAHLELDTEERIAEGASEEDARDAARRAFGNVTRITEDAATVWSSRWTEHARQDLRYAIRTFSIAPGFTLLAVLTLALGIGANAAIFTVVNAVLLRPLPFPGSDRVVRIVENRPPGDASGTRRRVLGLTASDLASFASQATTLSHAGTQIPTIRTLTGRGESVRLIGVRLSPALMSMSGTPPLLGHLFAPQDGNPGAEPVVILSHASWQRYFDADPNVVGQRVTLDGTAHTVIGVMGRGFAFLDPRDQFWMPMPTTGPMAQQRLPVTAQLKADVPVAAALAEVNAILGRPRSDAAGRQTDSSRFDIVRLADLVAAPVRAPLLMLSAAVGLVLLIACVNVAHLLLARSSSRRREMAVRFALGASRGRLIRQTLAESTLLALVGGVAGLTLAYGGVALLRALASSLPRRDLAPGIELPRLEEIALDPRVFALALAVSAIAGLAFGLIPAMRQSRHGLADTLRQGHVAWSGFSLRGSQRAQGALVAAEIAMATTLCVGAALLIQSLFRLSHVDPGYDPRHVLTFQISAPPGRSDGDLRDAAERLAERMQRLPGVRAVGYGESLPMTQVSRRFAPLRRTSAIARPPRPDMAITPDNPDAQFVSQDFVTAMGIQVVGGRSFEAGDRAGAPPVMLVNETLAKSGVLGEQPIGRQVYAVGPVPWTIVGVVEDIRQSSLSEAPAPQVFVNFRQVPEDEGIAGVGLYFCVRTAGDPSVLASDIRAIVAQVAPPLMIEDIAPMESLVSNSLSQPRLYAVLLGIFAGLALVLGAIGIYGVMAYSVARRAPEIGIRVALGAGRARVLRLVLAESLAATLIGLVAGLGGAAVLTRYLDQLLFGLTPRDPATFIGIALLFGSVATIAALVPARRALGVNPSMMLRLD